MLVTQQEQLHAEVTALVDRLGPGRSSLIPILQDVKRQYHGIDSDAMQIVADLLDIHPVEVYSVATFYAFLDPAAQGQFVVRLCRTISCELAGKDAIAQHALGVPSPVDVMCDTNARALVTPCRSGHDAREIADS